MAGRLVFIQHGDYRETTHRFAGGMGETCGAQRYSVATAAQMRRYVDDVCVVCLKVEAYDETLPNGVRGIGVPFTGQRGPDAEQLIERLAALAPSHCAIRTPSAPVINWLVGSGVRTLPILADSFPPNLRRWMRYRRIRRSLNQAGIGMVGNHNVGACRTLVRIGVDPSKIVPWDWPAALGEQQGAKRRRADGEFTLIYVGQMSDAKGLPDVIRAVSHLKERDQSVRLTVVGKGETDPYRRLAADVGVDGVCSFTGPVDHDRVLAMIREHDAMVVPSRHDYPEGSPKTVNEALLTSTPLIYSDHPVFQNRLHDGFHGLRFQAGNAADLAEKVARIAEDSELYERLSASAAEALSQLDCPVKWGDLIERWVRDSQEDRSWLREHTLASGRYGAF